MEKKTETNRFGKNHVTVWNIKQNNKGENMIAYIKGELVETLPGSVILDVRGIGYRIYISGRESEQLTKMGSQVKLHTYFHVKEDAMQLYGFQHKDDLEVFSLLLGVDGCGKVGVHGRFRFKSGVLASVNLVAYIYQKQNRHSDRTDFTK